MPRLMSNLLPLSLIISLGLVVSPAQAGLQDDIEQLKQSLATQERLILEQRKVLEDQQARLSAQENELKSHREKLNSLGTLSTSDLANLSGAGVPMKTTPKTAAVKKDAPVIVTEFKSGEGKTAATTVATAGEESDTISAPADKIETNLVYFAKGEPVSRPQVDALPDAGGVLTPQGVLTYENSTDYTNTARNVFTFQGVQVAEVVLVGTINATSSRRHVVQNSSRLRLGLTDRIEADVRFPLTYRNDANSTTTGGVTTKTTIEGSGIGDIDGGVSYQINDGQEGWPFLVGNLRFKADNADGPYDVPYNSANIADKLPTGSGFKTAEASITTIKVTDPAVLYANVGYVYTMAENVNRVFGTTRITDVDPGDAVNASVGMGFSINNETSFNLGYKHSHVFSTSQKSVNTGTGVGTETLSDALEVGALSFGLSYRFSPVTSVNLNVESGVTEDAPDLRVGVRVPVRLGDYF